MDRLYICKVLNVYVKKKEMMRMCFKLMITMSLGYFFYFSSKFKEHAVSVGFTNVFVY